MSDVIKIWKTLASANIGQSVNYCSFTVCPYIARPKNDAIFHIPGRTAEVWGEERPSAGAVRAVLEEGCRCGVVAQEARESCFGLVV